MQKKNGKRNSFEDLVKKLATEYLKNHAIKEKFNDSDLARRRVRECKFSSIDVYFLSKKDYSKHIIGENNLSLEVEKRYHEISFELIGYKLPFYGIIEYGTYTIYDDPHTLNKEIRDKNSKTYAFIQFCEFGYCSSTPILIQVLFDMENDAVKRSYVKTSHRGTYALKVRGKSINEGIDSFFKVLYKVKEDKKSK